MPKKTAPAATTEVRSPASGAARLRGLAGDRPLLALALVLLVGPALTLWNSWRLERRLVENTAREDAALYAEALNEFRTVYTSEVVARVRPHGIDVSHDYATRDRAIPLPATLSMLLGERIAQHRSGGS